MPRALPRAPFDDPIATHIYHRIEGTRERSTKSVAGIWATLAEGSPASARIVPATQCGPWANSPGTASQSAHAQVWKRAQDGSEAPRRAELCGDRLVRGNLSSGAVEGPDAPWAPPEAKARTRRHLPNGVASCVLKSSLRALCRRPRLPGPRGRARPSRARQPGTALPVGVGGEPPSERGPISQTFDGPCPRSPALLTPARTLHRYPH